MGWVKKDGRARNGAENDCYMDAVAFYEFYNVGTDAIRVKPSLDSSFAYT